MTGRLSQLAKSRWRVLLLGAADSRSGAETGSLWIGGCRVGFRSSFRQISRRTSREHRTHTAGSAATLVLWIRSGYAWSTKRLSERTWSECAQNWASPATLMLLRSVGVRTMILSSIARSLASLDGHIFFARNIFSRWKRGLSPRHPSSAMPHTCLPSPGTWTISLLGIRKSPRIIFEVIRKPSRNGWDSSDASYTEQILFCGSTTSGNTWVKENKSNRPGA